MGSAWVIRNYPWLLTNLSHVQLGNLFLLKFFRSLRQLSIKLLERARTNRRSSHSSPWRAQESSCRVGSANSWGTWKSLVSLQHLFNWRQLISLRISRADVRAYVMKQDRLVPPQVILDVVYVVLRCSRSMYFPSETESFGTITWSEVSSNISSTRTGATTSGSWK